jgi:hypothetical protein
LIILSEIYHGRWRWNFRRIRTHSQWNKGNVMLTVVVIPSVIPAEAGGSRVAGHPGLYSKTHQAYAKEVKSSICKA